MPTDADADWRVVVRHRARRRTGAFVAARKMRRRDSQSVSGLVLVLVINMGMLILISHRAQRLAQLQMNFVTAVSYELRTPLTVIISGPTTSAAAWSRARSKIKQYGSLIGNKPGNSLDSWSAFCYSQRRDRDCSATT